MKEVAIIEYDGENDSITPSSSSSYTSNLINPIESYVINHIQKGHCGYCYAWLDTGLCASSLLNIKCSYKHKYPHDWSKDKIIRHIRLLKL